MKKILVFAVIINAVAVSLLLSCFFEAERDNPYDPKSADYVGQIFMFASDLTEGGFGAGVGGRSGADSLCQAKIDMLNSNNLPVSNIRAFISINASDQIFDMPANYSVPTNVKIVGPTHIIIANTWDDLLAATFVNSVQDANVTAQNNWWSGTTVGGYIAANTCTNWTGTAGIGTYGMTDYTISGFYNMYDNASCADDCPLLCLAWE